MLRRRVCVVARPASYGSSGVRNTIGASWIQRIGNGIGPSTKLNSRSQATLRSKTPAKEAITFQQSSSLHSSSTNPRRIPIRKTSFPQTSKTPYFLQSIRNVSGKPLPQRRSWVLNFVYRTSAWLGASIVTVGTGIVIFFLYDASTYREDLSYKDINVCDLALSPRRGGTLIFGQDRFSKTYRLEDE